MESLFKTLKYEEVNLCEYENYQDGVTRLPYFIDEVYNYKRLHSSLGYRSPNDFDELVLIQENNGLPHQTLLTLSVQPYGCSTVTLQGAILTTDIYKEYVL